MKTLFEDMIISTIEEAHSRKNAIIARKQAKEAMKKLKYYEKFLMKNTLGMDMFRQQAAELD